MVASVPADSVNDPTNGPTEDDLIGMLDQVRHEYEAIRQRRADVALYAREHGLSFHRIAVVLDLTEGGARHLASRAAIA